MAVKVMLASAIAKDGIQPAKKARTRAKPRRRRSSVYDADGNEVFITLVCLKCHKTRPLSQFGLRKMADGAIRNQPWCRSCRSAASAERPREESRVPISAERLPAAGSGSAPEPSAATAPPSSAGSVAAQVAAALSGGWGK